MKEIVKINLETGDVNVGKNIKIIFGYQTNNKANISKVLLQKYAIPSDDIDNLAAVKDAIDQQAVMQYMGQPTAAISSLFDMGGGDIYYDPILIDITKAWKENYPFIVDVDTDVDKFVYVYRVLTYGTLYESATNYVSGLLRLNPAVNASELIPYIQFLSEADFKELSPENYKAFIEWANNNSLFHETYRLRTRGEIEDYKFSTFNQRAWMSAVLLYYLDQVNTKGYSKLIGDI